MKTSVRWLIFEYKGLGLVILSKPFKTNSTFNEYIFFNGKRIARLDYSGDVYYFANHLGTSRVMLQSGQTSPCYDADFYPYGVERTPVINSCAQNYKFTGKERDSESGLDNFGARCATIHTFHYVSSRLARFGDKRNLSG